MDDVPEISTDELVRWLEAKYRRHGEIEDGVAARRLASLEFKIERAHELIREADDIVLNGHGPMSPRWAEWQTRAYNECERMETEQEPQFPGGCAAHWDPNCEVCAAMAKRIARQFERMFERAQAAIASEEAEQ